MPHHKKYFVTKSNYIKILHFTKSASTEEYVTTQEVLHKKLHDKSSMTAKLFSCKLHDKTTRTGTLQSKVLSASKAYN